MATQTHFAHIDIFPVSFLLTNSHIEREIARELIFLFLPVSLLSHHIVNRRINLWRHGGHREGRYTVGATKVQRNWCGRRPSDALYAAAAVWFADVCCDRKKQRVRRAPSTTTTTNNTSSLTVVSQKFCDGKKPRSSREYYCNMQPDEEI